MAQAAMGAVGLGPKKEIHDLTGRVAVVVGGALGIGYEVSRAFALENCRVIMVNRKEEQGDEAIQKIKSEKQDAQVEWVGCDMGNLKEVKEVFTKIREEKLDRLDLLILSAGINANTFGLDADGIDRHFGVNWLGQFYVLNLLYPVMRKTSKRPNNNDNFAPRIVMESSKQHMMAPSVVHFGSLEELNNDQIDPTQLYGRSKLAMICGTKRLVEKVIKPNGDNIYVMAVHPGAVNTAMQHQWKDAYKGLTGKLLSAAMFAAGRTPEQGSYATLYCATSPEIEEKNYNGFYFDNPGQPGSESSQAQDTALHAALWELSTRLIEEKVGKDAMMPWDAES